jgi:hypothetical protein
LLEDAMFQWQQREALSPHRKLSTIATLLIHWLYFHVLANLDTHPTSKFGNIMLASRVVHKKQMGQCWTPIQLLWSWSHCHFISII